MIKVHCFVSCVCEVIKKTPGVDHRPFYFGVWDADFSVTPQQQLSYHSEHTQHTFFRNWYQLLYGVDITPWYQPQQSKQDNIASLITLLENKSADRHIMVMLDMYQLPERENKFNQNPFPHYVMLETTDDPDIWFMHDPDFRWEGPLAKDRIINAINQPTVAGGFYFDALTIRHTESDTVEAYFRQCLKLQQNPFTDALRNIIERHLYDTDFPLIRLGEALREIPVMAIRKYAYEHAFAYFWEALSLDAAEFEYWCDQIESLVTGYTKLQYHCMKLAMTQQTHLAVAIAKLLDDQDQREFTIKHKLLQVFNQWTARDLMTVKNGSELATAEEI